MDHKIRASTEDRGSREYGRRYVLAILTSATIGLPGCLSNTEEGGPNGDGFGISSPSFNDGENIPTKYTCDGENNSPPLKITGTPNQTESIALVVDDPDAPTTQPFVHWLLWNLPSETTQIPEDVPTTERVEALGGARQGTNSAGSIGYTGPCPPTEDGAHTYRFTVYALDKTLSLESGADRNTLDSAMEGRIMAETRLTGEYNRN